VKLAQACLHRGLAFIAAPARQRPLTAMGAQAGRAQRQQQGRTARAVIGFDKGDGDRGPLQRGRRFGGGQPCKRRAARGDIPPCGIIEWSGHPA
jgi:hypothetical protein